MCLFAKEILQELLAAIRTRLVGEKTQPKRWSPCGCVSTFLTTAFWRVVAEITILNIVALALHTGATSRAVERSQLRRLLHLNPL